MWRHLLEIYDESRLNEEHPECLFAETLIFNEGWLLRSVLKEWKTSSTSSKLPFLPFPVDALVYSEGQLRTPFKARPGGDPLAESNTRVDGIAGSFTIRSGTKAGLELEPECGYVAVFEAKLYSPLSKCTKNAPDYDQVSRTAACLINSMLRAGMAIDCYAHLVVLYARENRYIRPMQYNEGYIESQIANRIEAYKAGGAPTDELAEFERGWRKVFPKIEFCFVTWEDVLAEIDDHGLSEYYDLCKCFNR